ncbi:MAG: hypothetical protein U9M95_06675 [Candidatus Altiarchaeota archaeon]|nr:hypothetical protein [Candidatus Altiarchaeota archaeon]
MKTKSILRKSPTRQIKTTTLATILVLLVIGIGFSQAVMAAEDILPLVREINKNMDEFKEATEVIHEKTDTILGVVEGGSEVADMTETVHLSSHALKHIGVYMENDIAKLDGYKADPAKNRAEMLVAAGKIDALRKMYIDTGTSQEFVTTMELPYTGKSPHDLAHLIIKDKEITASTEAKSAADEIHTAMHTLDDASKAMRLNLEELGYALEELEPEAESTSTTTAPSELATTNGGLSATVIVAILIGIILIMGIVYYFKSR